MYYIEQIYQTNGAVQITVHSEAVTKAIFYRDYATATPQQPFQKETPAGMVYVDVRNTLEEALDCAGEAAQKNGTLYGLSRELRNTLTKRETKQRKGLFHAYRK